MRIHVGWLMLVFEGGKRWEVCGWLLDGMEVH